MVRMDCRILKAYSVLHGTGISTSEVITSIAKAHGSNVSNQQVVMRWVTQHGIPVVSASNVSAYDLEDIVSVTGILFCGYLL